MLMVFSDFSLVIISVILFVYDLSSGCMVNFSVVFSDGSEEFVRFGVGLSRLLFSYLDYLFIIVVSMLLGIHIFVGVTLILMSM